jgi:hypothetical protein
LFIFGVSLPWNFSNQSEKRRIMMKSQYRMLSAFVVLLVAISCMCSGGNAVPTAIPTNALPPTSAVAPTNAPPPTSAGAPTSNVPQPPSNDPPPSNGNSSALVTFTDQNNYLAFDLPGDWTYKNNPGDKFYTDVFTSPDGAAKIESLVYDDGTAFVKSQNGQFALYLLNTFYSNTGQVGDIRISGDQIQKDGSERLEWTSKGGGYSGYSYFETRGSNNNVFLMFTAWWVNGTDQTTLDTINNAISSYYIP